MSLFRPVVTDLQNQSGTQIPRVWCLFLLSAIADLEYWIELESLCQLNCFIYICIHIVSYIDISCICIHLFIYIIHMFPTFPESAFLLVPQVCIPFGFALISTSTTKFVASTILIQTRMRCTLMPLGNDFRMPVHFGEEVWNIEVHCVTSADMFNDIYLYVDLDYAVISWYDTILYDVYGIFMS